MGDPLGDHSLVSSVCDWRWDLGMASLAGAIPDGAWLGGNGKSDILFLLVLLPSIATTFVFSLRSEDELFLG